MPTPFYNPKTEGPYTAHFRAEVLDRGEGETLCVPRDLWRDMKLESDILTRMAQDHHDMSENRKVEMRLAEVLLIAFQKGAACHDLENGNRRNMMHRRHSNCAKLQSKDIFFRTRDAREKDVHSIFGRLIMKAQIEAFRSGWAWATDKISTDEAWCNIKKECIRQMPPPDVIDLASQMVRNANQEKGQVYAIAAE